MIKLQELGFIQVDYTTSLLPQQQNNTRRTMFSVTPEAHAAIEKSVAVRKGTYPPESIQSEDDSQPQCGLIPSTVGLNPIHHSLIQGEKNARRILNIRPNASASVQARIDEFEKRFREETNYHCSWNTRWRYAFPRFARFVQLTAHDPRHFKF